MSKPSPIHVMVVDDHPFMRELICRQLDGHKGQFKVVAQVGDIKTAYKACKKFQPHLIILDINLPDGNGIRAVGELKQTCGACRILLCTAQISDDRVVDALRSGADGFVEKTNSWAEFMEGVERVSSGERYFYVKTATDAAAAARAERHSRIIRDATLSAREREVLRLVAEGLTSKEIGETLGISASTVDVHRVNLMKKIHVRNIAGLVTFAFRMGLIR